MKKAACFFTGGHTEANFMPLFLEKINSEIKCSQFCPNRPKRRKRPGESSDLMDQYSGLTGASLLQYVYSYLDNHPREFIDIDAIIIEDDLDGRFTETLSGPETTTSKRTEEFQNHCQGIVTEVRKRLRKNDDFPVVCIFAAPEIEAWFLSDWANTFGLIYGPKVFAVLSTKQNQFFSAQFAPYIRKNVLHEYAEQIENYGYFNGAYYKLSDQIVNAFDSFKISMSSNGEIATSISLNQNLKYSKRFHGDEMLRHLSPDIVQRKCPIYFKEAFDLIRNL